MLDELIRVLDEKFRVKTTAISDYVLRLNEVTQLVKPNRIQSIGLRDRSDTKVIECANAGRSAYIVTGDRDLLSMGRYKKIRIVAARQFLKTFHESLE